MVSPDQRREAAAFLQRRFHVSERRPCRVIGLRRSTRRYKPKELSDADKALITAMREIAGTYKQWGYRRVMAKLRARGFEIGKDRLRTLWRKEGLHIKAKPRKRRRLGVSANAIVRRRAEHPNHC